MHELLPAIAIIGSSVAGLYDLKTTNMPDRFIISLAVLGLLFYASHGIATGEFSLLMNSILVGSIFTAFGALMYFTGQWGGGDGEMLAAIGFMLPSIAQDFFVNLFFIGALYTMIFAVGFGIYRKLYTDFFKELKGIINSSHIIFIALSSFVIYLFHPLLALLPVVLLLSIILIVFLRFVEEKGFYRRISTKRLNVDDMLGEDISSLKLYKKHLRGLTKEEVLKIRRNRTTILIREGVRFGPAFPLTLLFTLLYGNFAIQLITWLAQIL